MRSPADALSQAVACQQQGRLPEAARLCSGILKSDPDHFDARHLLAIIRHRQGRAEEAIDLLAAALARKPDEASAHSNYGLMLHESMRHAEALASFDCALALVPNFPEALNNRGSALMALARHGEALASFDRALALNPRYGDALYNRGTVLHQLGRHAEALASYDRALSIQPAHSAAFNTRGAALSALGRHAEALASYDRALAIAPAFAEAFNNRGSALAALGRHDGALASFDKALAVRPDYAQAHYNRAVALDALDRPTEALASCERALAIEPDYPEALNNRGVVLDELGRHDEALASYEKALMIRPDYAEALNNRGTCLIELGRCDEALASYDRALALKGDYVECHWNRSLLLIRLGRLEAGWPEYEWRRKRAAWEPRRFEGPEWTPASTAKRVLVYAEQGLGDTIQFARFAKLLAEAGKDVILEVQPVLRSLLGSLGAVTVVGKDEALPAFDAHVPVMSLPQLLGVSAANLPAPVPYLAADPARVERWGKRLQRDGSFKVGIAWQGNPKAPADQGRSIPLAAFAPLGRIGGVRLISLQKHDGVEQLADLPDGMTVETLGEDFDAGPDAFLDSAAVMMNLDLVISSDTAIVHLAGALARPVWMPLKLVSDWRWMLERDDTPWYPTVRLFRQRRRGQWDDVFANMASELAQLAAS